MRSKRWMVGAMAVALMSAGPAMADVWDVQTENDNTSGGTENELIHGSDQLHDLGALAGPAADTDWYRISQKPYSSYEVVADATSGDIGTSLVLTRTDAAEADVQTSVAVGVGYSRSLRWMNTLVVAGVGMTVDSELVKVTSGSCSTNCGADDVYRLRAYETTYAVPRFNNAGSQITVLVLQNPTDYAVTGNVYFWNISGALIATHNFTLAAKNTLVLNTGTVAAGVSGTLTVAHNARYGDLAGKTVALEPSTGFSFDTPMVSRPH